MLINSKFIYEALLGHNYLPAQRRKKEELPPIFSSETFTPKKAAPLLKMKPRTKGLGFDLVEYRATKFNALSRNYGIPHPIAYAQLSNHIARNWASIESFQKSSVSMIRPKKHKDKRIIIMDYDRFQQRSSRVRNFSFNKKFVAKADISNCFPSIYTHAIPWAAVGKTLAKNEKTKGWHNKLDFYARQSVRGETQGLPVGPGTSNIICEILLSTIDSRLGSEFDFIGVDAKNGMSRYIDDYTYYCDSFDQAERFLRRLDEELNSFKLHLNPKKTTIMSPSMPHGDIWASELSLRLPSNKEINSYQCINFLDYSTHLASKYPDGSVLKYAAQSLLSRDLDTYAKASVLDYLLVLSVSTPVLIPLLESLFDSTQSSDGILFKNRLIDILRISASAYRSDAMAWALYYCKKYNIEIPKSVAEEVIGTNDCIAILTLYNSNQHFRKIKSWANKLQKDDPYTLDRYWILLYQMHLNDHIDSSFCSVPEAFDLLKANGVTFIK